jgi:hypothetical protein
VQNRGARASRFAQIYFALAIPYGFALIEQRVGIEEQCSVPLIGILFRLGPLWFGMGFLAPVLAALIVTLQVTPPLGLSPLVCGLIVGGFLGVIAMVRGTWL